MQDHPVTILNDPPRTALKPRHQRTRGQMMVEMALLLPVLILILAAAADFGRAFTAYIAISGVAREGAAYGMLSKANAEDSDAIESAALADAPTIWGEAPSVSSTTATDSFGYQYVQVTVTYQFTPIMQVPGIPSVLNMNRIVRMRVIS